MGPCRVATGWGGGGAALWPAQLSFLVSSRGLYLAAPQRCHCDLFKAMSSSRHDNMSLALQRHHRIAAAKKQIASIDPAPPSNPHPIRLPVLVTLTGRKEEASRDKEAAFCLT